MINYMEVVDYVCQTLLKNADPEGNGLTQVQADLLKMVAMRMTARIVEKMSDSTTEQEFLDLCNVEFKNKENYFGRVN